MIVWRRAGIGIGLTLLSPFPTLAQSVADAEPTRLYAAEQTSSPAKAEVLQGLQAAASQGNAEALNQLGKMYQSGNGLPVDYVKAYALFHLASSFAEGGGQLAAANRNFISLQMSASQLTQAQDLLTRCYGDNIGNCVQRIISAGEGSAVATLSTTREGGRLVIPLENFHGIYVVRAIVNGSMSLTFAVDSGATNVTIPADVVASLVRAGSITKADFLGESISMLADGSKASSRILRLRSVKVGDVTIEDVRANVTPENGPLLLGQSFLRKLKSWSMDNTRHALVIE
jgi:clan AA aspartic protease (TIGR02281 family)